MQTRKSTSVLVERGEETFEFGEPTRLPDGRVTVGVVNHSHDDPEEHVYSVFFEVETNNGVHVHASRCSGPGYKFHGEEDTCKHCEAAEQCAELLGCVLEAALGGEEEQDAHATAEMGESGQTVATDGGKPEDVDCVCHLLGGLPCYHCVMNGDKTLPSEEESDR